MTQQLQDGTEHLHVPSVIKRSTTYLCEVRTRVAFPAIFTGYTDKPKQCKASRTLKRHSANTSLFASVPPPYMYVEHLLDDAFHLLLRMCDRHWHGQLAIVARWFCGRIYFRVLHAASVPASGIRGVWPRHAGQPDPLRSPHFPPGHLLGPRCSVKWLHDASCSGVLRPGLQCSPGRGRAATLP